MTRRRIYRGLPSVVLIALTVLVSAVSADIVPRGGPAAGGTSFEFSLDLRGYRDAAVSFDFVSLLAKEPLGFTVSSASGLSYLEGFRLLNRARSWFIDSDADEFAGVRRPKGFQRNGSRKMFSTAMFNLAAYDGQTVLLNVAFNDRAVERRGAINVGNLTIDVQPLGALAEAAAIPEPTSLTLTLCGLFGLLGTRRLRSRTLLPH